MEIAKAARAFVKSLIDKDENMQDASVRFILEKITQIRDVCVSWSYMVAKANPTLEPVLYQKIEAIENHFKQLASQLNTAAESITDYGHYINAQNEMRHWFEILVNTNNDINEFFDFLKSNDIKFK